MEKTHIKVLLIEDNPGDVRLIWEILSEVRDSPFYLNVAENLLKGLQAMEKERPDVILLDLSLPDSNGIYTLNRVRDRAPDVPIVILTGMDDEITAIKSMKEGAQDYLVKGRTDSDLLKRAMVYAIERNRLIGELEVKQQALKSRNSLNYNFILMVFHELLTPVASIKSAVAQVEKAHGDMSGADMAYINIVRNNTQRIFGLMDDLIDVSEIEAGTFAIKKKDCDLKDLITTNIADLLPLTAEKNITVAEEMPAEPARAMIDNYRISQALTNLMTNSLKFSMEGTIITVKLSPASRGVPQGAPEYVQKAAGNVAYYHVQVRDNGAGFTTQDRDKIFNNFFSSSKATPETHRGIGIGLLIAKNIINAHGGILWADSGGENMGSEFNILLPAE
ncbi:MAG: hybrid sensor histidine kinase/response regulator [Spirochaetia bacterium]|nr:hybrid sensor histidine kinase/response regulator [Spirochaetia bacterium]